MEDADEEMGFIGEFASPDGHQAVIVEDDGRVCYAYLLDSDGKIVSDVWLYNRCPTPTEPEWHRRELLPFANPALFVNQTARFVPPVSSSEVTVDWVVESGARMARVLLGGDLFAKLTDGIKPGWARLAAKDGPLARVLSS
jgi:hypothetical protein